MQAGTPIVFDSGISGRTMSTFGDKLLSWVRENHVQRFSNELALNRSINVAHGGNPKGKEYPAGCYSGRCDVVIPTSGDRFRWVEVKYAQTYFSQKEFRRDNYKLFEKHVFSAALKEHSVRNDLVRKIGSLVGNPAADHLGMLVVFLYSELYPLPGDTFARLDSIAPAGVWCKRAVPAWPNPDHNVVPSFILPVYWERTGSCTQ